MLTGYRVHLCHGTWSGAPQEKRLSEGEPGVPSDSLFRALRLSKAYALEAVVTDWGL